MPEVGWVYCRIVIPRIGGGWAVAGSVFSLVNQIRQAVTSHVIQDPDYVILLL